jgi:hypothetical protein
VNGSIQELLERSPFLEGLDRRDLVELPQLGVGEGFPVRRAFAGVDLRALDPFVHMDQVGEVNYAPGEPKGTPWHPHIDQPAKDRPIRDPGAATVGLGEWAGSSGAIACQVSSGTSCSAMGGGVGLGFILQASHPDQLLYETGL